MPENAMELITRELRSRGSEWFPDLGEPRAVRIVGHTPKSDHYIYDIVIDFARLSERLAAKVYRAGKGVPAHIRASSECNALRSIWSIATERGLDGVPRPIGDFSIAGAVVCEKLPGIPLQSIIMKAALLPGYAGLGLLQSAARAAGGWLREFQQVAARPARRLDGVALQAELEKLCHRCKGEGLDDASIRKILTGSDAILSRAGRLHTYSAVLNEFTPLNVVVSEQSAGFSEFARMEEDGSAFTDPATFLACVEALEKYPFCTHTITTEVQESFLDAYAATEPEREMLKVVKMKILLSMFVAGRTARDSAARKKVMWANVMKKFIQTAADRSLPEAA